MGVKNPGFYTLIWLGKEVNAITLTKQAKESLDLAYVLLVRYSQLAELTEDSACLNHTTVFQSDTPLIYLNFFLQPSQKVQKQKQSQSLVPNPNNKINLHFNFLSPLSAGDYN